MTRVALGLLLLALGACQTTELQRKEAAIQTALASAFLACQTALNSPEVSWGPGAREYCELIVKGGCQEHDPR